MSQLANHELVDCHVAGRLRLLQDHQRRVALLENHGKQRRYSILDTNPSAEGHCLIIPKKHVQYWHDLSDAETSAVFNAARLVAKQIKKEYRPDFVCVFIRGGRVKHTHVVLFPSQEGDRLSGFPQSTPGKADINFKEVQKKLQVKNTR